ncbi:MAG: hypothetical protein ABIP78_11470 [Pyrinomonadaceae bacterium]
MDIFCLDKAFVTAGIEVVNAGMYCPKCKESFEEGTRRFCPTDGARLISEIDVSARQKERGIFANLIPKIDATSDFDQALSDPPRFVISESDETTSDPTDLGDFEDIFFELEDITPEPVPKPDFVSRLRPCRQNQNQLLER